MMMVGKGGEGGIFLLGNAEGASLTGWYRV